MTCWTGPMKYLVRGPPHSNLGDDSQEGEEISIKNRGYRVKQLEFLGSECERHELVECICRLKGSKVSSSGRSCIGSGGLHR
ncbi:hypothetical protein TNCV_1044311 [Trichonephila clavipes]|nr:hypothetical protein TNCV_1044311 [Trichonephila clavipes]